MQNSQVTSGAMAAGINFIGSHKAWDTGSALMLIAGGCADNTPALCGALTFDVSALPSGSSWAIGSANKIPILFLV